jgi:hypothetical protein
MRIQRIAHRAGIEIAREIDMRHLPERMHAGVGAAGALHRRVFAAEICDGCLQDALHRGAVGLELPALKRRAVIFDRKLVAGHA